MKRGTNRWSWDRGADWHSPGLTAIEVIITAIIVACIFILVFLFDAAIVWVFCWALNAAGIAYIGAWKVEFSWALVIVVILIEWLFKSIISVIKRA